MDKKQSTQSVVLEILKQGRPVTLTDLKRAAGNANGNSVAAAVRSLRKFKNGQHNIAATKISSREWTYQLLISKYE